MCPGSQAQTEASHCDPNKAGHCCQMGHGARGGVALEAQLPHLEGDALAVHAHLPPIVTCQTHGLLLHLHAELVSEDGQQRGLVCLGEAVQVHSGFVGPTHAQQATGWGSAVQQLDDVLFAEHLGLTALHVRGVSCRAARSQLSGPQCCAVMSTPA
jgi:hypothetical protein